MRRILASCHILLYIMSTSMQLDQALARQDHNWVFLVMLGLIIGSSVFSNLASLAWIYHSMEFAQKRVGEFVCVLLHLLQLGPIWRYIKLLMVEDPTEIYELTTIRMLQTSLQDAPFIVLQGYLILSDGYQSPKSLLTIGLSLLSLAYTFTCTAYYEGKSKNSSRTTQASAVILQFFWHFFMLISRLLCFIVFTKVGIIWLAILLSAHLLCRYISGFVKIAVFESKERVSCKDTLPIWLYGYTDMYELSRSDVRPCGVIGNYVFVTMENVLMMAVWFMAADKTSLNISILGAICGTFLLGIIMSILYHKMTLDTVCCSSLCFPDRKTKYLVKNEENNRSDIESNSEAPQGYDNGLFDIVTHPMSPHLGEVDSIDVAVGSDSGISVTKPTKSPRSPAVSHKGGSCHDAHTSSDSGCHSRTHENISSSWSQTPLSRNASSKKSKKSNINNDIQKLCEDIRKECESISSTQVTTGNRTWELDFDLDVQYFGDDKVISEHEDESSSGCYGDISTICSMSQIAVDIDSDTPVTSTPLSETILKRKVPALPRKAPPAKTRPGSLSSSGSYSSTHEDSCTTCRESYLRHLGDWCTVTTSTSEDSIDDLDSDLDYMTWPPRKISIVNIANIPKEKLTLHENVTRWMEKLNNASQTVTTDSISPNINSVGLGQNHLRYVDRSDSPCQTRVQGRQATRSLQHRTIVMGTSMFQRPQPIQKTNNQRGSTRSLFVKLCSVQPSKRKRSKRKVILFNANHNGQQNISKQQQNVSIESMV